MKFQRIFHQTWFDGFGGMMIAVGSHTIREILISLKLHMLAGK